MRTLIAALPLLVLLGCQHSPDARNVAGPVVFIDAAGNRMVVNTAPEPAKPGGVTAPVTPAEEAAGNNTTPATELPFAGEMYVDAAEVERDLAKRDEQRFFIVPDGTGGRQYLPAGAIGAGEGSGPPPPEAVATAAWQTCRVIVSLLVLPLDDRHELVFPVKDEQLKRHAGYLLPVSEQTNAVTLWSYVKESGRPMPVLARVDVEGRILAIVNNMPTQLIPETRFRYGKVGGSVSIPAAVVSSGRIAVLDGALLRDKLPPSCGLVTSSDYVSDGQVSLQFRVMGDK